MVETLETAEELAVCEFCGKSGEDLSLLSGRHKKLGLIKVCRECWIKLNDSNSFVCGSSGSGKSSCPTCGL